MEFLIIVDAQNDFITGKLAVPGAEKVVKNIKAEIFRRIEDYLSTHNPSVCMIYTHDVHTESKYLSTIEGSRLPVHCLKGTSGCELCTEMIYANYDRDIREHHIFKEVFALWIGNLCWNFLEPNKGVLSRLSPSWVSVPTSASYQTPSSCAASSPTSPSVSRRTAALALRPNSTKRRSKSWRRI